MQRAIVTNKQAPAYASTPVTPALAGKPLLPGSSSPGSSSTPQLRKVSYTHEAMIDLILQDPTVTPSELAECFSYSPNWVSRILCSDSFQARLAQRKAALIDPIIARSLNDRLRSVAIRSMEVVEQKLTAEPSAAYAMEALALATSGIAAVAGTAVGVRR